MLAILSDIHGNLPALEAVLEDAFYRGCTGIISLGDVVGYYSMPDECITLLRSHDVTNILGNHDNYIVSGQNCARSRVVAGIIDDHRKMISADNLTWLSDSVDRIAMGDVLMLHGGPNDPVDEYIYEVSGDIFPEGVRTLMVGHTHVQILLRFGEKVFCNPGSVGQPRDGDPRAAYISLANSEISLHRVSYDIDRTVADMQAKGYKPFLYRGLYTGAQINGRVDTIKAC